MGAGRPREATREAKGAKGRRKAKGGRKVSRSRFKGGRLRKPSMESEGEAAPEAKGGREGGQGSRREG